MTEPRACWPSASGLADRICTVRADLDQAWPDGLKTVDLVWAANSLHQTGDPARAVAQIYQMLRPGGLLAVTEQAQEDLSRQ